MAQSAAVDTLQTILLEAALAVLSETQVEAVCHQAAAINAEKGVEYSKTFQAAQEYLADVRRHTQN